MKSEKIMLACIRKADFDYGMFENGDKVLLGLSGGKDSMALARLLHTYQQFSDKHFEFIAAFMDLGFEDPDIEGLKAFGEKEKIDVKVIPAHDVATILRMHKDAKGLLPCSICSRMKKAVINKAAKSLGCNKVAFAHHADDAIETLFMNMSYGGRIATFEPKMTLEREGITFIRPLIYAREKDIKRYVKDFNIPVFKNKCGNDKKTEREDFKETLASFYDHYPYAYDNFLTMLTNEEKVNLFYMRQGYAFGDGVVLKKVISPVDMTHCLEIRMSVFVKEQNVPVEEEIDGKDEAAIHFLLLKDNRPIGTMRVFLNEKNHSCIFGRVAIIKEYRGLGYGKRMLTQVEKILSRKITPLEIHLGAQEHAVGFYERLGFKKDSKESYLDANIKHFHMTRNLQFPIPDKEKL
jgi:tRNA 2-thiocytidine biosynthesis protein TtcA